jgi:hypothetical protein
MDSIIHTSWPEARKVQRDTTEQLLKLSVFITAELTFLFDFMF